MDENKCLIALSESGKTEFGRVDFSLQSDEQKTFSAIWALESQVNNGGFLLYFESSDGETANYAPVALRRIGADKCAAIVERALRVVSSIPLPSDCNARMNLLRNLDEAKRARLNDLDTKFFAYPDDLTNLLFQYISSQPRVFGASAS